jgi:ribosomal-protein-alanine N-acetyltransferase
VTGAITPLIPDDAEAMARLHRSVLMEAWDAAAFYWMLKQDGVLGWKVMHEDMLSAFILVRLTIDEAEILSLATQPAQQQQGHARLLLKTAIDHLKAEKCADLHLEVRAGNMAAISLYEQAGFTQSGHRPRYYPDAEDALLMHRSL